MGSQNEPALMSKGTAAEYNRKAESGVQEKSPESINLQFKLLIFQGFFKNFWSLDFYSILKLLTGSVIMDSSYITSGGVCNS